MEEHDGRLRRRNDDFPADVLAEILPRLPPSARRRARLVCRLWRDVVNERTTEMQSRPKVLLWGIHSGVAYVVDDLSSCPKTACRELWRRWPNPKPYPRFIRYDNDDDDLKLIGTCNGLLCLCDNNGGWTGGSITLVNPATGEELPVPQLPCGEDVGYVFRQNKRWDEAYGFGYHPTTGRYKVVHVPCSFSWGWETDVVHVFTVGDKAWREVRPGASMEMESCDLDAGIVSVDGTAYWVTNSLTTLVSFDLDDDERVDSCDMPSNMLEECNDCNLTEVHGRLGIVVRDRYGTKVWVREARRKWSCWYDMACTWQDIPRPHFVYGEYFLKAKTRSMYVHRRSAQSSSGECDVVEISHRDKGMLIAGLEEGGAYDFFTFAHVETLEPLGVYKAG